MGSFVDNILTDTEHALVMIYGMNPPSSARTATLRYFVGVQGEEEREIDQRDDAGVVLEDSVVGCTMAPYCVTASPPVVEV